MVSMKDIALHCGVSVATVSKALNGHQDIGEATRERITQAVLETQNQYLTSGGRLVDAVYSAADGGATEDGQGNVYGADFEDKTGNN